MPQWRSFRLLWVALIPMLVFPLYGQTSCNRNCPPSSNPCQRSVGRSIETNQCVYTNLNGATCDDQGVTGICSEGQCLPSECAGVASYGICDEPLNGGLVGACVEDLCVLAAPEDECVRVGVGRINCCSQQGCAVASGTYCTDPLDDVSCDPTGVEPPGQTGQDGICDNGTCIAQTGLCADVACPTSASDPCARDFCDTEIGQCEEWVVTQLVPCVLAGAEAVCHGSTCIPLNDPGPCAVCDDGDDCSIDLCDNSSGTVVCDYEYRYDGETCMTSGGFSGECRFGRCLPVFEPCGGQPPDYCTDGNPCTTDECEPTLSVCRNWTVADDTPCRYVFPNDGLCRNGVCLPDLCIGRDCDDGDSCTDNNCIAPFGICENPTKDNGEPCDGEPGECIFGNCALGSCASHAECDNGNDCTIDTCDFGSGLCSHQGKPSGTACTTSSGSSGECRFGRCQPVISGF